MDISTAVATLAALANDARLRVFRTLVGEARTGMTPGVLSEALDIPASTLSFHLKELVHAGLLVADRNGRNLIYRPAFARMDQLMAYLLDHCCEGEACEDSKDRGPTCP